MDLVVFLTVGGAILADVFSCQNFATGFTFEAAQVPLSLQCQQSLSVLNVSATAGTRAGTRDAFGGSGGHGLSAVLAQAVLPIKRDSVTSRKRTFADGADEAGWVVGLPQSGDHLPLHKLAAGVTAGAMDALVVQSAQVVSILHEESSLSQVAPTHFACEALDVEVLALHS